MSELCVALDDVSSQESINGLLRDLRSMGVVWVKVGLESFSIYGSGLISDLKQKGFNVFVDLKLFDIPNTMTRTLAVLDSLGTDLTTVHGLSGFLPSIDFKQIKLIGVTLLTSWTTQDFRVRLLRVEKNIYGHDEVRDEDRDRYLISLAQQSLRELQGIVISSPDLRALGPRIFGNKNLQHSEFVVSSGSRENKNLATPPIVVVPGIRLSTQEHQDQKQVTTPQEAVRAGATLLVVGRPIVSVTPGLKRQRAIEEFLKEM